MEAFVITLREGMEAALVVGLILTYLNRTGRIVLRRWVYAGLGLAVAASLLGAVGFSLAGFDPENEVLEGTLLAIAAVLVFSLVVWMWRASRGIKQRVESQLEALTASDVQARRQGWGLLAFVFFMVFREGVEMILFLAALSLAETPDLVGLIGGAAGVGGGGVVWHSLREGQPAHQFARLLRRHRFRVDGARRASGCREFARILRSRVAAEHAVAPGRDLFHFQRQHLHPHPHRIGYAARAHHVAGDALAPRGAGRAPQ